MLTHTILVKGKAVASLLNHAQTTTSISTSFVITVPENALSKAEVVESAAVIVDLMAVSTTILILTMIVRAQMLRAMLDSLICRLSEEVLVANVLLVLSQHSRLLSVAAIASSTIALVVEVALSFLSQLDPKQSSAKLQELPQLVAMKAILIVLIL